MWRAVLVTLMVLGAFVSKPAKTVQAHSLRDQNCAKDVAELTSGGFQYGDIQVSWLTGCAHTKDGAWTWPGTSDDPNLIAPWPLTGDRATVGRALSDQVNRLLAGLDATPFWDSDFATWGDYFRFLDDDQTSAYGLGVGPERDGPGTKGFSLNSYRPLLMQWLQEINALELAYMVQWWEQGKLAAMPPEVAGVLSGRQSGNAMVIAGYADATGFWRTPWPWELASPYMQAWFVTTLLPAST